MNIWIMNHYAIPPSMGGLNRHYYFSKYWTEKGHDVQIFTSSKIHNTDLNMIEEDIPLKIVKLDGVDYTFIKSDNYSKNGISRIWNMIQFPLKTYHICKKKKMPDIIYTSTPDLFTAYMAIKLAKKNKIPCVVEVRDLWPESIVEYNNVSRKNPIIKCLYKLEKWIYSQADRLIFTMEGGKKYIEDQKWEKNINLDKIEYVNNGVDLDEFLINKTNFQVEEKDLFDISDFNVIYTGSIRRANDIGAVLDAAKLVGKLNKRIKFQIYGDGTQKDFLESRVINENIDNVTFKGYCDKKYLPYILSQADLTLLNYPSHDIWKYGGSQNKLFEYFASGTPVLSTIQMGYDIISKYNAGISLAISTPEAIAESIIYFEQLPEQEYLKYCENAQRAAEEYDYIKLSNKLIKILDKEVKK